MPIWDRINEPPRSKLRGINGEDIFFIPLTLTLSHPGEREQMVTLQRATGNYQVKIHHPQSQIPGPDLLEMERLKRLQFPGQSSIVLF